MARLGTAEGGAWAGSHPSALLCSPVPKQDGTPPRETSASDVHPWPLRPAWGEKTSMADGWVDTQEGLVESGGQMNQGNRGAGGGGRGIAVARGQAEDRQRTDSRSGRCRLVSAQDTVPGVAHQSHSSPGFFCVTRDASAFTKGSGHRAVIPLVEVPRPGL